MRMNRWNFSDGVVEIHFPYPMPKVEVAELREAVNLWLAMMERSGTTPESAAQDEMKQPG